MFMFGETALRPNTPKAFNTPRVTTSDVKYSRPRWRRGQNFGLGLGLGLRALASASTFGLGLASVCSR